VKDLARLAARQRQLSEKRPEDRARFFDFARKDLASLRMTNWKSLVL